MRRTQRNINQTVIPAYAGMTDLGFAFVTLISLVS
ncbi:MAG: hypothetical protein JWO70_1290 [Betaproteobacteria bacterium]|nr:hypothetical protein [Betaproteobacteria bacterium]